MILLLMIVLAGFVHADSLEIETRDDRMCSRDTCLSRVPLGATGLALTDQVARFEASFTENFEPKVTGRGPTYEGLLAAAGAAGLSPANRARLLRDFSSLTVRELASDAREVASAAKGEDSPTTTPLEIRFFARVDWRDHAAHGGSSAFAGRLVFPRDRPFEIDKSSAEINRALTALVEIDAISTGTPSQAQLAEYVIPATLSNLIVALLTPPIHLEKSELRIIGALLRGADDSREAAGRASRIGSRP